MYQKSDDKYKACERKNLWKKLSVTIADFCQHCFQRNFIVIEIGATYANGMLQLFFLQYLYGDLSKWSSLGTVPLSKVNCPPNREGQSYIWIQSGDSKILVFWVRAFLHIFPILITDWKLFFWVSINRGWLKLEKSTYVLEFSRFFEPTASSLTSFWGWVLDFSLFTTLNKR